MAWTTPRTWVVGEVVTAAIMNAHVRDNENYVKQWLTHNETGSLSFTIAAGFSDGVWCSISYASAYAVAPICIANGFNGSTITAQPVRPTAFTTTGASFNGQGGGNNPASASLWFLAIGAAP